MSEEVEYTAKNLEEVLEKMSKMCTPGDEFTITLKSGRIITLEVKQIEYTD